MIVLGGLLDLGAVALLAGRLVGDRKAGRARGRANRGSSAAGPGALRRESVRAIRPVISYTVNGLPYFSLFAEADAERVPLGTSLKGAEIADAVSRRIARALGAPASLVVPAGQPSHSHHPIEDGPAVKSPEENAMTRQIQDAYIVAAVRTPVGKAPRGMFRAVRPDDLLAHVLKGAIAKVPGLDPQRHRRRDRGLRHARGRAGDERRADRRAAGGASRQRAGHDHQPLLLLRRAGRSRSPRTASAPGTTTSSSPPAPSRCPWCR